MNDRREFMAQAVAGAVTAAMSASTALGGTNGPVLRSAAAKKTPRFPSLLRRDETILRLGGDGGMTDITWTRDDRQLVTVLDGCGWPEVPKDHYYSSRL